MLAEHTETAAARPWSPPDVPDAERSIEDLCREWRMIEAQVQLDLIRFDDDANHSRAAHDRQRAIEDALAEHHPTTPDEANKMLRIVLENLEGAGPTGSEAGIISAVMAGNRARAQDDRAALWRAQDDARLGRGKAAP